MQKALKFKHPTPTIPNSYFANAYTKDEPKQYFQNIPKIMASKIERNELSLNNSTQSSVRKSLNNSGTPNSVSPLRIRILK